MIYVLAIPLALLWLPLSNRYTVDSVVLGYVIGLAILFLLQNGTQASLSWRRLPRQLFWLVIYVIWLFAEIFLSSLDVARRVLDPRLPINPGHVDVATQDITKNSLISALSIHAITVTPGQLVDDIDRQGEPSPILHIHCLDTNIPQAELDKQQIWRLTLIRRILGDD
jgi:multicomponent Na+:H+ antiporter subunit E